MNEVAPKQVKYIKLGESGKWEKECLANGTLRLDYESSCHIESLAGQWDIVKAHWLERKGDKGVVTKHINQIRAFYELSEEDLWITFYQRKLYWCRASSVVEELENGSRIRKTIDGWSCKSLTGQDLTIENLDGRVTKVQGFRGTICDIKLQKYLVNKINGHVQPEVKNAKQCRSELKDSIKDLIKGLWWNDFELLTDLIFSNSGWQRISVLGKTEKDIDLDLFSPVMQKRAFVQIKSQSNAATFEKYIKIFKEYDQYAEMYFVVHTSDGELAQLCCDETNIHLMDLDRLAELVINTGLTDWLITKRS